MAVEILYRSSRDPETTFMDRKEAEAHDQMLELAEQIAPVIRHADSSISEDQAENLAIFMAKNRDVFAKAFAKKPELLADLLKPQENAEAKLTVVDSSAA